MSSFDLINLMTLIQNLPLNFDVAFYNWLKILPPTLSETFFYINFSHAKRLGNFVTHYFTRHVRDLMV